MKKKYIAILLTILSILSFVGCNKKEVDGVEVRIAEKTEAIEKKDSGEEIALLTDTFWNGVTKVVYYDFDEEIYDLSISGKNINFDGKSYKVNESIAEEVLNKIK